LDSKRTLGAHPALCPDNASFIYILSDRIPMLAAYPIPCRY